MSPSLHDLEHDVALDSVQHHAIINWYESFPSKEAFRVALFSLQARMLQMPQAEILTSHIFEKGYYTRVMKVKAGTVVIGGLHTGDSVNVLSKGDMTVATEHGIKRVQAGYMEISHAGTKRIAYAHKDSEWRTVIQTLLTDPNEIEKQFTAQDFAELGLEGDPLWHSE